MAINKVVYGDDTLIDLTNTTATADRIVSGTGAYGANGVWIDGTLTEVFPSDDNPIMDGTASPGVSINYSRADHVHPHDSLITNRNLLDNWYFIGGGSQQGGQQFPINQRGQVSYTSSGYGIDRWYNRSAPTVTVSNDGVNVSGGTDYKGIYQAVSSKEALLNKTVTITAWITAVSGGTARIALGNSQYKNTIGTVMGDVSTTSPGVWSATFTMPASYSQPYLNFTVSGEVAVSFSIAAVKLEIGDSQTLAHQENGVWVLNEIPNYETEFLRCKTSTADPSNIYANGSVEFGSNIGIVQNTNTATQNISKEQYVIWHGALYKASSAITSGTTLSGSNLSAVTDGGLNDLKSLQTITPTFDETKLENVVVKLRGYVLTVTGTIKQNVLSAGYNSISFSLPSKYAKDANPNLTFTTTGTADDSKSFYGVMTGSAISVRASDSNSVGTGLNFYAITTINI